MASSLLTVCALATNGCASALRKRPAPLAPHAQCQSAFTDKQLVAIVDDHVARRGDPPNYHWHSVFRVHREQCDYYLTEIFEPDMVGAYYVARISDQGEVLEILGGL